MPNITEILFWIAGYGLYNDKPNINEPLDEPVIINNEIHFHKKKKETNSQCKNIKLYLKYIYGSFVFFCILYPIVYITCQYIQNNNLSIMNTNLFNVLLFIQSVYGIYYCDTTNFIAGVRPNKTIILCIIYVLAITASLTNYFFIQTNIIMIFSKFYGYLTFLINTGIFVLTMLQHKKSMKEYSDIITHNQNSVLTLRQNINIIITDYSRLKIEYTNSVNELNIFFVSLTFIGMIYLFFVIQLIINQTYTHIDIINIIIIMIVEIIYILSIQGIANAIEDIYNMITEPQYLNSCIKDNIEIRIMPDSTDAIIKQSYITDIEISEMNAWMMLHEIIKTPWKTFSFLGIFEITEKNIFQKLASVFAVLCLSSGVLSLIQN